jgi:hypothetical protein
MNDKGSALQHSVVIPNTVGFILSEANVKTPQVAEM